MAVIDAQGAVMGRLASKVAKRLLNGEDITIVNAESVLITGTKKDILTKFRARRKRGKPRKGPHYPRMPDRILRRTVRGMLPYQRPHGRAALKRLKVFIGVPSDVDASKAEDHTAKLGTDRFMSLGEVSKALGARFGTKGGD
jgi:large subunit ribosomal protein L13